MLLGHYPFRALGSPCELRLYGESRGAIDAVAEEAKALVLRIERKYSRYRDDSVVTEINRSAGDPRGVRVDDETANLLDYAATAWQHSDGLFDVTSGSLRQVWNLRSGRVPSRAEVTAALARVGWRKVRWQRPRIVLTVAGMELDFGGFGKEWAVDCVSDLCRARGVRHGMIDLGGDLRALGPHPDGRPWIVGVRDPRAPEHAIASVAVFAEGLATSGDYERCMVVDGVRYTHILDPRTGWPVRGLRSATALATQCLVAGSATTIALLKGDDDGARFLDRLGLPNLRVHADGRLAGSLSEPRARRSALPRTAPSPAPRDPPGHSDPAPLE
ncbi:MAG TPA: FAD:protein FMN transferase [Myxococcota bacterium]|nr:FAD:protein FMN transferase [Myxococcota bacterium]